MESDHLHPRQGPCKKILKISSNSQITRGADFAPYKVRFVKKPIRYRVKSNGITTDLYRKPTDRNQAYVTNNIPFSVALNIVRIQDCLLWKGWGDSTP